MDLQNSFAFVDTADILEDNIESRFPDGTKSFLYWKGRVGLYAILKAYGIGDGDEVILPAFTCVVVPNAIIYLGAVPVYVDIERSTLNTTLEKIKSVKTEKTKAVICQNTFGLSSEVDSISEWARVEKILSIEDCTHGLGGTFKGRPNGSYCDAAFFSTQWNKPVSSGIGGIVITANDMLIHGLNQLNERLISPSKTEVLSLKLQLIARKYFLTNTTYWFLLRAYRWLSKHGIVVGSSSDLEIEGTKMPDGYFKGMSQLQALVINEQLGKLDGYIEKRKANAEVFTSFLKTHGKWHVSEKLNSDHSFLKYPILVENRVHFMQLAEDHKIELGDWFNSPLHPVQKSLEPWGMDAKDYPVVMEVSSSILNLPTLSDPNRIVQFLAKNLDQII